MGRMEEALMVRNFEKNGRKGRERGRIEEKRRRRTTKRKNRRRTEKK